MIVSRCEKHIIKKNNIYYNILDGFCFQAKNLYNHANYIIRNEFCNTNKWIRFSELDKILKLDIEYPDYREMPTAQSAQQLLRNLDSSWSSFFKSIKDWGKHKEKYNGRPKLPKYKEKNGRCILTLTNQNVRLKDNVLKFPKKFNGFEVRPRFIKLDNFKSFQQIRFIPHKEFITVECIYNIEVPDDPFQDNERYLSVDIGLDNLATITTNVGLKPIIINGKGLKSINKYYNKQISHYREIAKRINNLYTTRLMNRITFKRNNRINDYLHKASKFIIDYALSNNINTIVVGKNKDWKRNSKMNKVVNQSFVGIPHQKLLNMIKYKAENIGINYIETEESYTSGTSFLDNELPTEDFYNKSRRKYRGLFVSNDGIQINADVNAAFQILKKVFPNAYSKWDRGCALHPVVVNMT